MICYAKWNANKRAYFPQTKVEQARQRRADGRLRRLAIKQDEVLLEANPQRVIEHMENQTVIPFNNTKQAELMAELNALPVKQQKEMIYFKDVRPTQSEVMKTTHSTENSVQRWIRLDEDIQQGQEVNQEDRDYWEMFPMSKKFKQLKEDDTELNNYLAQRLG